MGIGSLFFGDPERRRREKQERDTRQRLESKRQKEINDAYIDSKIQQRIINAKAAGVADANKLANRKPLHEKLMGLAATVGKDMVKSGGNKNFNSLFTLDDNQAPKRKRRKNRKKR